MSDEPKPKKRAPQYRATCRRLNRKLLDGFQPMTEKTRNQLSPPDWRVP